MDVEEQDDSLGASQMILQCLLGEPGADCGKGPILHELVGRDMWM